MIEWMRDSREEDDADINLSVAVVYAPTPGVQREKTTRGPVTGPCVPGKPPA
jgi:hypothetical protein